jgi:hypothetical protein
VSFLGTTCFRRAVYLYAVYEPAYIFEPVSFRACIDDSFPVAVRPSGYPYRNVAGQFHTHFMNMIAVGYPAACLIFVKNIHFIRLATTATNLLQ